MLDFLWKTLFILLMVFAVSDFVLRGVQGLLCSRHSTGLLCKIIPIRGHHEQIELDVRNAILDCCGKRSDKACAIVLLDFGMDAETHNICNLLSQTYDCVQVCTQDQLCSTLLSHFPPC